MCNTKEEFLQKYEELLRRCAFGIENHLNLHSEFMYLISAGYLKLGYKTMSEIDKQMEEISERISKERKQNETMQNF